MLCRLGSRLFRLSQLFCSACYTLSSENKHHNLVIASFSFTSHYSLSYIEVVTFRHIPHNLYSTIERKQDSGFTSWEVTRKKDRRVVATLRYLKPLSRIRKAFYLSLISFEDCHSPWMLHIETAMSVPGLLVFIQVVAA